MAEEKKMATTEKHGSDHDNDDMPLSGMKIIIVFVIVSAVSIMYIVLISMLYQILTREFQPVCIDEYTTPYGEVVKDICTVPLKEKQIIDSTGGYLELKYSDIQLHIPPGAIDHGTKIEITLEKLSTGSHVDLKSRMSSVVRCGPSGITFNKSVSLSLPHNVVNENAWNFSVVTRESHLNTWYPLDDKSSNLYLQGDQFIIETSHFCDMSVVGASMENGKQKIKFKVTGRLLEKGYLLRVRTWRPLDDENVEKLEYNETFLEMHQIIVGKKDLTIRIDWVHEGWHVEGNKEVIFDAEKLWQLYPSHAFYLKPNETLINNFVLSVRISCIQDQDVLLNIPIHEIHIDYKLWDKIRQYVWFVCFACFAMVNLMLAYCLEFQERRNRIGAYFDKLNIYLKVFILFCLTCMFSGICIIGFSIKDRVTIVAAIYCCIAILYGIIEVTPALKLSGIILSACFILQMFDNYDTSTLFSSPNNRR